MYWDLSFVLMHILRIVKRDMFKVTKNISSDRIIDKKLKCIL